MSPVYLKLELTHLEYLTQLLRVYEIEFEMTDFKLPVDTYLVRLLYNPNILFYVAIDNNLVVGGLTAHILPSVYSEAGEVYIYDLAIKSEFQRKGIARQLLIELKQYCAESGYKEVFVQADIEDQHALDFYRATGGKEEHVFHYSYSLEAYRK
ncbi:MAG: hypothetical protein A3D31_11490 [Candidatus Fluviicola riflensis]|nr:MAG: hypothetical protein CHH17_15920 [Candidatus Fluviicola riflensis]OGS77613.1 MAG: hypothetical protein A3D31_11490 [Candidatus Fluviicola riflensis]OGS84196.1 MAG: hypothetical protein A3E30_12900 [Fluviicola sp. RIFCSPHIGHO2_12_FULL_43_24]OGS84679.1 MAG: hypothetical protein A2724_08425 [Fluviicola sp. RIFCSPHIGHO2_01_FULL_43_53]